MNISNISAFKNFSYTILSNIISLIISVLIVLIVPKFIGVQEYGLWQTYLFYSSYVGFLHFGWSEGIYLRYGGANYKELNKEILLTQFIIFIFFQITLATFIFYSIGYFNISIEKISVFNLVLINMVISNSSYFLFYILQATNKLKEFSTIVVLDRMIYCFLVIILLIFKHEKFVFFVMSDLFGKCLGLFLAVYYCKNIVFGTKYTFNNLFLEIANNISSGIKLLFSSISGMLIVGIPRFGIEKYWSVVVFGKISLILSISNFVLIFINAIGLVLFPILRRMTQEKLTDVYSSLRNVLSFFLLGTLFIFFPISFIIDLWLPNFSDVKDYLAIIFPLIFFEGKTALLLNTYFKTLRLENILLRTNYISLLLSVFFTFVFTLVIKNLYLLVFSIVISLAFRSVIADVYLSKKMKLDFAKTIYHELLMIVTYLFIIYFLDFNEAAIMYLFIYFLYALINKKQIINSIRYIYFVIKSA